MKTGVRIVVLDLLFASPDEAVQPSDLDTVAHMVVLFASPRRVGKSYKVKLLKLLWHADTGILRDTLERSL